MYSKLENPVRKSYNSLQLVIYGGIRDLTKTTDEGVNLDCNQNTQVKGVCDINNNFSFNRS